MAARSEVRSPTKNSQNGTNQIETLHAEFCKNILKYQKYINIQKRAIKFYNHLKGSNSQTFHYKVITYREINLDKSLKQLVLGLCSET